MSNGPIVAPAWSSASFSPKTQPAPIDLPAYESIASTVGLRMPRPVRSATTRVAASGHRVASASAGTASRRWKSTRLNSSHDQISYAVFCLKKKKKNKKQKKTKTKHNQRH